VGFILYRPKKRSGVIGKEPEGFCASVVGESHKNYDGESRQSIIKKLKEGDIVQLAHEKNNKYDDYAVAVISDHGQIGYLKSASSAQREVIEWLEDKTEFKAKIHSVGKGEGKYYGVVLDLVEE
jgi:hypothetical protein